MSNDSKAGIIKLSDGTVLKLRVFIIDVREAGFSPFAGIEFAVKTTGGISAHSVPEELKKAVINKPLAPSELPKDGWEIIDIIEQEPAVVEEEVNTSKGRYKIKVVAEAVMASRNMKYRNRFNEPIYWVSWVLKISWKPIEITKENQR